MGDMNLRQTSDLRRENGLLAVCVFCGSSAGNEPAFTEAARKVGALLATNGVRLVYGGGDVGLMGEVARSTLEHGGYVTGITPEFLQHREQPLHLAQELIVTPDMHTRKRLMYERADAFIALPGGIGTLEELVEQMTWSQLGQHTRPIMVLNTLGFWDPLLNLLSHMRGSSFIRPGLDATYFVASEPEDAIRTLLDAIAATPREDARKASAGRPAAPGPF